MGLRVRHLTTSIAVLTAAWTSTASWGWPPDVAPEFNFSSSAIRGAWSRQADTTMTENPENAAARERMRDIVAKRCGDCQIEAGTDRYGVKKYRVTFTDGWWFDITLDPAVVEITAKPAPLAFYETNETRLSSFIFDIAGEIGLTASLAGHLNFGVEETFGGDVKLFRNFLVDFLNHVELSRFIVHDGDTFNAPLPIDLSPEQHEAFRKLVDGYDFEKGTIQDFSQRLLKEVYYRTTWDAPARGEPADKYHSMNVKSIALGLPWPRLEMRSVRFQKSMAEFLTLIRLFQGRMTFLKSQGGLVEYAPSRSIDREAGLQRYLEYSRESGISWTEAQLIVPEHLEAEVKAFNEKHALPSPGTCARLGRG
jgi:hypothetical protein